MKKIVYSLSAILLTVFMQLNAQDVFYVDASSGDDGNPGTSSDPWESLNISQWTEGCTVKISGEVFLSSCGTTNKTVTLEGITDDAAIAALTDTEFENNGTNTFQLIYVNGGILSIKNMAIKNVRNTTAASGGLIYVAALGTLNLDGVSLKNFEQTAGVYGGAMHCLGEINAENTTFENNSSQAGGAVFFQNGSKGTFENCIFKDNKAVVQGGAIMLNNIVTGSFEFNNCYFTNNQSTGNAGGAIWVQITNNASDIDISLDVINCTFAGNHASGNGGAIAFANHPTSGKLDFTIANSTFYKNTTSSGEHGVAVSTASAGGANSNVNVTGTHIFANNTFYNNAKTTGNYSAMFLNGQRGSDLVFVNNMLLEETRSGSQGLTVEVGADAYQYKSYIVKNNIFGRIGGSYSSEWTTGFRVEVNKAENNNVVMGDANYTVLPEDKAATVGLATTLTIPTDGSVPYLELTNENGLAVDFGISTVTANSTNIVPQTDITGKGIYGTFKDAGAFEYQKARIWSPQNSSTDWHTPGNWSDGRIPEAIGNAFIPKNGTPYPVVSENATVADLTIDLDAQINIVDGKTLAVNKIHGNYSISHNNYWDAVGFPYDVANIYCPEYAAIDPDWDSTLYPYKENAGPNEYTDFWLKDYDDTANSFGYVQSLTAGKGYIIQFPSDFGSNTYTAVFESMEGNNVFENKTVEVSPAEGIYRLVANPTLGEITLKGDGSDDCYYYRYVAATNNFKRILTDTKINAFESVISVRKSGPNPTLRSFIALEDDGATTLPELISELNDPVVEKRYYTLQGIEIGDYSDNGVYLVKKIHESGRKTTQKVFNVKND